MTRRVDGWRHGSLSWEGLMAPGDSGVHDGPGQRVFAPHAPTGRAAPTPSSLLRSTVAARCPPRERPGLSAMPLFRPAANSSQSGRSMHPLAVTAAHAGVLRAARGIESRRRISSANTPPAETERIDLKRRKIMPYIESACDCSGMESCPET